MAQYLKIFKTRLYMDVWFFWSAKKIKNLIRVHRETKKQSLHNIDKQTDRAKCLTINSKRNPQQNVGWGEKEGKWTYDMICNDWYWLFFAIYIGILSTSRYCYNRRIPVEINKAHLQIGLLQLIYSDASSCSLFSFEKTENSRNIIPSFWKEGKWTYDM